MKYFLLQDRGLQKKIAFTLLMLAVYRLLARIPLPGMDAVAVRSYYEPRGSHAGDMVTIIALGLAPFLSACLLVQIFGPLFPAFGKRSLPGNGARETAVRWAYRVTLVLSLFQAYFIARFLCNPASASSNGMRIVLRPEWLFTLTTMLSLTGAIALLLFLARLISRYGLGNGIAVLFLSGIVSTIPEGIHAAWEGASRYSAEPLTITEHAAISALCILVPLLVVILFTVSVRRVPIRYEGSNIQGSIPLRLSWPCRAPMSLAYLPLALCMFIPSLGAWDFLVPRFGWSYSAACALMTFFFTYLYTAIVFSSRRTAALMSKFKCRFIEDNPSANPDSYLERAVSRYIPLTALFLIAVTSAPGLIAGMFGISYSVTRIMGGAYLLIIIGVLYDIKCQIDAYLQRRDSGHGDDWTVTDVSWDEIEAEIKRGFLGTRGIPCVVEPSRFTWGMPIRTAVDEYRLWVTSDRVREAREALA